MGTAIGELLLKEAIELESLSGRVLGVDSYNILYQFISVIRSADGAPLMDSHGNITSHLTGLLYRTTRLMELGVKPVFVFDGKPHKLKAETLEARNRIRTEAGEKYEKAKAEEKHEEARKFAQQASRLTEEMLADAKRLIELMGIPIVQAPSEGEAQLAQMNSENAIYGSVSQDYDSLLFGAKKSFRNITITGKRKLPGRNVYIDIKPELIDLEKNLHALKIDREKLIWLGILIGTDFNEKFPNIGSKRALALVQKHNSFEKIIEETKFSPEFDYKEVEEIFMKPSCTKDYKIEFAQPDDEKIISFLCRQHDFSEERVKNALAKLHTKQEEKRQSKLEKWFK